MNNNLKEAHKLQVIRKADALQIPRKYVTGNANADSILTLTDDYPGKNYTAPCWVSRLLSDSSAFEFQKDLKDISFLEYLSDADLNKVNKDILPALSIEKDYLGRNTLRFSWKQKLWQIKDQSAILLVADLVSSGCDTNEIILHIRAFSEIRNFSEMGQIEVRKYNFSQLEYAFHVLDKWCGMSNAKTFHTLMNMSDDGKRIIDIFLQKSEEFAPDDLRTDLFAKNSDSGETAGAIREILENFNGTGNEYILLSKYWLQTGELSVLRQFIKTTSRMTPEERNDLPPLKNTFIDVLSGGRLSDVRDMGNHLLEHICINNKFAFVRKVRQIKEERIVCMGQNLSITQAISLSVINSEAFTETVNINELSTDDIRQILMLGKKGNDSRFQSVTSAASRNKICLSPKIFLALMSDNVSDYMIYTYASLVRNGMKPDEALIRIRELPQNHKLDLPVQTIVDRLVAALEKNRFSTYMAQFASIKNATKQDVLWLITQMDIAKPVLSQITNAQDLRFVLSHPDLAGTLEERKQNDLNTNSNIEFLQKAGIRIQDALEFSSEGNLAIARDYYASVNTREQQENILKIVKAAVAGKLATLKYADFDKEVGSPISKSQKTMWIQNTKKITDGYLTAEYDDFRSTMIIGEYPVYSCQSYKSGTYNECLLSNFDANKKILYVTKNGEYLARAILRFTKASDEAPAADNGLSFMDIDEHSDPAVDNSSDFLCLFLERPYIKNGVSEKENTRLRALLSDLARQKAKEMGMPLYCNSTYDGDAVTKYIYISKSKNGRQYLDSLCGQASTEDEKKFIQASVICPE